MFVPTEFKFQSNMYAVVQNSFTENKIPDTFYTPNKTIYTGLAYWISPSPNTKNALCFGEIFIEFSNTIAFEVDGRRDYSNLSDSEIFKLAEVRKFPGENLHSKNLRTSADRLFGNGNAWSTKVQPKYRHQADEDFIKLTEKWRDLPKAPQDTYGWHKLVKNR